MGKELAVIDPSKSIVGQLATNPAAIISPTNMRKATTEIAGLIAKTLPVHLKRAVDRVGGALTVEMNRNPFLANCTAMSLIGGLIQATSLGLEIGSALGQAYLVPRFNKKIGASEATFQVGYRGLIVMAGRTKAYKVFDAHIVYENDEFDIGQGTDVFVLHKPLKRGNRGPIVSVYANAETVEGGKQVQFMTIEQVKAFQAKYAASDGAYSPWVTAFDEMARKTPLRNLGKRIALSPEIQEACGLDESAQIEDGQRLRAVAAAALDIELPALASDTEQAAAEKIGAKYDPDDPANDEKEGRVPPKKK